MEGTLLRYGPAAANVAFMTAKHRRHVIMVGGLTDGLLACKWVPALAERLDSAGWGLVQALLTSSYTGWGLSSLDTDAHELQWLAQHLKKEYDSEGLVLVGHSTGSQDCVRYAQRYRGSEDAPPLLGIVLQAPVSDREIFATLPETADRLRRAEDMIAEGLGEDILCRADHMGGGAVTARRLYALAAVGGDDDMFSSDFCETRLSDLFERIRRPQPLPTLLLMAGADEYVPSHVDKQALGERLAKACGEKARLEIVEGGRHALEGHVDQAVDAIAGFIADLK